MQMQVAWLAEGGTAGAERGHAACCARGTSDATATLAAPVHGLARRLQPSPHRATPLPRPALSAVFPNIPAPGGDNGPTFSDCARKHLAAKPKKGSAVLFHSIKPSGEAEARVCACTRVLRLWACVLRVLVCSRCCL